MAIIRRLSTVRQGGIVFTGNTLGLAPATASGGCFGGAPFTVTAFYGKGCGCRGYSVYYPYY